MLMGVRTPKGKLLSILNPIACILTIGNVKNAQEDGSFKWDMNLLPFIYYDLIEISKVVKR